MALVAIGCAGLVWRIYGPLNVGWPKAVASALAFALLFSITGAVLGINRVSWTKARAEDVGDLILAWAIAAGLTFIISLVVRVLPLGLLVLAFVLALCGSIAIRYRTRLVTACLSYAMRRRRRNAADCGDRVVIVGAGQNARYATLLLNQPGNVQKFQLVGLVDDDPFAQGMRLYGATVVGTRHNLPGLIAQQNIKVVILADPAIAQGDIGPITDACRAANSRVVRMPDLASALGAWCGGADDAGCPSAARAEATCLECLARRSAVGAAAASEKETAGVP